MTEEVSGKQVSFCQCLIHESKKAYAPWLKVVIGGLIIAVVFVLTVYWRDSILNTYTQFVQLTDIVPWYVYILTTSLLLPLVYATGVCINKRSSYDHSSNICIIALMLSLVFFILGAGIQNILLFTFGALGISFAVGIARD